MKGDDGDNYDKREDKTMIQIKIIFIKKIILNQTIFIFMKQSTPSKWWTHMTVPTIKNPNKNNTSNNQPHRPITGRLFSVASNHIPSIGKAAFSPVIISKSQVSRVHIHPGDCDELWIRCDLGGALQRCWRAKTWRKLQPTSWYSKYIWIYLDLPFVCKMCAELHPINLPKGRFFYISGISRYIIWGFIKRPGLSITSSGLFWILRACFWRHQKCRVAQEGARASARHTVWL